LLVLFFDNFTEEARSLVDNWDGVVMGNEIISVPDKVPFMFAVNVWHLSCEDKVYCLNESAAQYLEKCPCGQKYSVGFDYNGFERVELDENRSRIA